LNINIKMNQKERSTIKYIFNFIYGLICAVVMSLILFIITIVYSPVALLLWFVTRKSFLESWGGIQEG